MHTIGVGQTDKGRIRDRNEDMILVDNALGLYVVCDGMGGHAAGEVASRIAIEALRAEVEAKESQIARGRRGEEEEEEKLRALLHRAAQRACEAVYQDATQNEAHAGMGCTLTALLVVGNTAFMAHVGDTRLYLLREGALHQLSRDHTYAAELVRSGSLKPEDARRHRFSHVLSRALGAQERVQVDTLSFELLPEDRLLLCSDGLHGAVESEEALAGIMGQDFEAIPDELIQAALPVSKDNISAIAVQIQLEAKERPLLLSLQSDAQVRLGALGSSFLFKDLALSQLAFVLQAVEVETFEAGQTIHEQGEVLESLMIVAEGELDARRDDQVVAELGAGDTLGMTALIRPRPARASLVSREPGQLLVLRRESFQRVAGARPWLGMKLQEQLLLKLSKELDRRVAPKEAGAHAV